MNFSVRLGAMVRNSIISMQVSTYNSIKLCDCSHHKVCNCIIYRYSAYATRCNCWSSWYFDTVVPYMHQSLMWHQWSLQFSFPGFKAVLHLTDHSTRALFIVWACRGYATYLNIFWHKTIVLLYQSQELLQLYRWRVTLNSIQIMIVRLESMWCHNMSKTLNFIT